MNIYDFNVTNTEGNEISLKDYAGKIILVINSATECGFTPLYAYLKSQKGFAGFDPEHPLTPMLESML